MMLDPDAPDPMHFLRHNVYMGYYTMPKPAQPGEKYIATIYVATGNRMILTRRSNPEKMQVYLQIVKDAATERLQKAHRHGVEEEKAAIAEICRGAGWKTEELLKGLEKSDDFYLERLGVVKLDSWSKGRVVLVGDAAHCPTAVTGMGTTAAMVGTYILAGEIEKHCGRAGGNKEALPLALKEYEQKHRPFITNLQKGVAEGPPFLGMWPSSWFGVAILNLILRLVSLLRLVNLAVLLSGEDRTPGWSLPEYEGMVGKEE
jgi:2-polyprenyl-6-methoxyphenol hydroxylase-like FAD-dependent oxidoreductase